ncbi:hypothetical protein LSS_15686 [Leptospira santarosai serovar Shermani str. LT 821]|uniref:Uncharacterized protein n=1 Tax=Leptospira santarosai serovar Shermani str. LT 821 TaxID=758847 RepID=K8XWD0_9LEPT|nr:hypothetical protein LSS_15686 [Leptospira santarosai serovar Shermani str. LT 821]
MKYRSCRGQNFALTPKVKKKEPKRPFRFNLKTDLRIDFISVGGSGSFFVGKL